jgi:hypothetical protein
VLEEEDKCPQTQTLRQNHPELQQNTRSGRKQAPPCNNNNSIFKDDNDDHNRDRNLSTRARDFYEEVLIFDTLELSIVVGLEVGEDNGNQGGGMYDRRHNR